MKHEINTSTAGYDWRPEICNCAEIIARNSKRYSERGKRKQQNANNFDAVEILLVNLLRRRSQLRTNKK